MKKENIALINQKYNTVFKDITVAILGMGGDGHTASLFPSDPTSEENLQENLQEKRIAILSTKAPKAPVQRITCSKQMLLNANEVFLMTTGKEKYEVLNNNNKRTLPIFSFIDSPKNINWYYSI